jgi:hypothetical protein
MEQAVSTPLHAPYIMRVSCLAYSSTQKMAVICSCKISVAFYQTTWHYIPARKADSLTAICEPIV